jgi:arylformamidase
MLYDISIPVNNSTVTWPTDPALRLHPVMRMAEGAILNLTKLEACVHVGTHFDAPFHFIADGARSDEVPLEAFLGPVFVAEMGDVPGIERHHLERLPLKDIERLLFKTRNSALLKERVFRPDFTYLSGDAARYLADFSIKLVGIDYLSIDQYGTENFPAHHALLGRGIAIVEGVDLAEIREGWYELVCLPMKLTGVDGAPVRAVLRTLMR